MGKEKNLERITSFKEFRGGVVEGFTGPICVPYNIGNIKEAPEDFASIQRKSGRIFGGMVGGLGLIAQGGIYSLAAYKGYPEAFAIPTGASVVNYLKSCKERNFVTNMKNIYKSISDPFSLL